MKDVALFDQMSNVLVDVLCDDNQGGKPLIHCRAGIGRSGTLVTIVSQLYQMRKHPKEVLSIQETLTFLRKYRAYLVETHSQYTFIYRRVEH